MATKDTQQQASRPLTHRSSISSGSVTVVPISSRQSHGRTHSTLLGLPSNALNNNHRVGRRKSMTATSHAAAALTAAALKDVGGGSLKSMPILGNRRNVLKTTNRALAVGSLPSPPSSLPIGRPIGMANPAGLTGSAIDDANDTSDGEIAIDTQRHRRASEGQHLGGKKMNRTELHCETCGKSYKHSSCLNKHKWEHTPQWQYTSKLLISKHQQVQLLEAASTLMAFNNDKKSADDATPPDSVPENTSDRESASPEAFADSDRLGDQSSADTTPPPHLVERDAALDYKRYSSGSGFSRSYQSVPSVGSIAGSAPTSSFFGHYRQLSQDTRPTTAGTDDMRAVELQFLGCSVGSNNGVAHLPADVPPVPPVPAQYLDDFIGKPPTAPMSFTRGEASRDHTRSEYGHDVTMDDDDDVHSRVRSDEDEDIFGQMEE